MTTALIIAAFYIGIPVVSIWITGRKLTWQGWLVVILLWPIGWLIFGPEELP